MQFFRFFWLLLAFSCPFAYLFSQQVTFQKTYGGEGNEIGNYVIATGNGYLVAGYTHSSTTEGTDAYLLRVDAEGNLLWQKTYGGNNNDAFTLVTEANDGGFVAMGETESAGAGGKDVLLVKTDADGVVQWTKTFGGSADEISPTQAKLVKFPNGYLIAGYQSSFGSSNSYLARLTNSGDVIWEHTYEPADNFLVGNYIVGDTIYAGGSVNNDGCFAKINANTGAVFSLRSYPKAYNDALYNVRPTQDGNLLLSDGTWSATNGAEQRQWLVKVTPEGDVLWSKIYGKPGISLRGVANNVSDGGFILVPYTGGFNPASDANLVKVDADGGVLWAYSYGGPSDDQFLNAVETSDGGFIAVGTTYNPLTGDDNLLLVKTNAEGLVAGCAPDVLNTLTVEDFPTAPTTKSLSTNSFPDGVNWSLSTQTAQFTTDNYCAHPIPADSITGVVNIYTPVTGFNCDSTRLQVGSAAGFSEGDEVLIIQMQGAMVDQSNSVEFGIVIDAGSSGNYEFNRVQSVSGSEVQLKFALSKSYEVTGKVQLVRVPEYADVSVGEVTCQPWNGTTGGVLALDVHNTLTLNGNVDVRAKGFRGGLVDDGSTSFYHETQAFYPPNPDLAAAKGEGIALLPINKSYGRGHAANGGGGGNAHNAGGAGGANAGNGGNGGNEYYAIPSSPNPNTQGLGGAKTFENTLDRIIMGGGGGAGHSNDLVGSSGGNGGGIIILRAQTIQSNGHALLAAGEDIFGPGGTHVNDGEGGGGAGGTILLDAKIVNGDMTCDVNGGRGGDCLYFDPIQIIGPGGGGSGGKIWIPQPIPTLSVELGGGIHGVANQNLANGAEDGEQGNLLVGLALPVDSVTIITMIELSIVQPTCTALGQITVLNEPTSMFSLNSSPFQSDPTFNDLEPGQYLLTVADPQGCSKDTLITLTLQNTLIETYTEIFLCPTDTIMLGGVAYTQPATVMLTLPSSIFGCDTLATYEIIRADNILRQKTLFLCSGDSVVINGMTYTQAGTTISYFLPASVGCDTLVEIFLQNAPQPTITKTVAFCPGDSVTIDGVTYSQPDTVSGTIPAATGCDTLVTYILEFSAQPTTTKILAFCPGDSVTIDGNNYGQPGTVSGIIPAATGCDTLVTYVLEFLPQPTAIKTLSFCPGDSIFIDGTAYSQPGNVSSVLAATSGCDTLVTYVLQFAPQPTSNQTIEFCAGDTVVLGGIAYTQPGTVNLVIPSTTGDCDTLATYILKHPVPSQPTAISLSCPADKYVDADPGQLAVVVNYDALTATTDCPCPGVQLTLQSGLVSGGNFPLGATDVCYNAKDSCGNSKTCCFKVTVEEKSACDIKEINCIKYELLSITEDAQHRKTYRIRTTNNCANRMTYMLIELPDGLVADQPLTTTTYTAPGGRTYLVRNPNFSPFYSIRYLSVSDSIQNGESDVFQYTLPQQADVDYIHVQVRLETGVFYEAYLNTFFCPIEYEPNNRPAQQRKDRDASFALFPNPTTGNLFIDLSAWQGQNVKLRIFSSEGGLVQSMQVLVNEPVQSAELPADLPNGLYFMEIEPEQGHKSGQRFVVQH